MKVCSQCQKEKPLNEFYKRSNSTSYYPECKRCFTDRVSAGIRAKKKQAIEYLGGQCADCGVKYHPSVYDFHHLRNKDGNWRQIQSWSFKRIKKELDKCVLLCSNCHRLRHANVEIWNDVVAPTPIEEVKQEKVPCRCGNEKYRYAKTCRVCVDKTRKTKIIWPNKEELSKMVWETPRSTLAKTLGVSDRAIGKRCAKLGIAQPPRGYWAKLRSKK